MSISQVCQNPPKLQKPTLLRKDVSPVFPGTIQLSFQVQAGSCQFLGIYTIFSILQNPSLFLSSNNVSSNATNATSSETVNVVVTELVLCDTNLGIPQKCSIADPVYNNQTKTCSNVVTEVKS